MKFFQEEKGGLMKSSFCRLSLLRYAFCDFFVATLVKKKGYFL